MTTPPGAPGDRTASSPAAGPRRVALLSFLFPGLGHAALRMGRLALLFATPVLAATLGALVVGAVRGPDRAAVALLAPSAALAIALGLLLFGAWRLLAMWDGVRRATPRQRLGRGTAAVVAVLALAIVVPHISAAGLAYSVYRTGTEIFVSRPDSTPRPLPSGVTPDPSATPTPTPVLVPEAGRFSVLLVGQDYGPGRTHSLTDTMIVVSVDVETGDAAMISVPRDVARFPMVDGGTYGDRINGFANWADRNPERFPAGGMQSLAEQVGYLVGIPVNSYAAVNLQGFERMIDAVGGITIVNAKAINDPGYGGWTDGRVGFTLPAGTHTLDGATALAYVRSRKGTGDNDFTRARRQQQLLVALGRKLTDPTMVPRLPSILDAVGETIRTNVDPGELFRLLDLAQRVDDDAVERVVLGPPYASRIQGTDRYLLQLDMDLVAEKSVELFGGASRYAAVTAP